MTKKLITKKDDKITVNLAEVPLLAEEGSKIVTTPKAERALLAILALEDLVTQLKEAAKERLGQAVDELRKQNPNLTSIHSDNIVVRHQQYGYRYTVDEKYDTNDLLKNGLVTTKQRYYAVAKKIDEYKAKYGQLPVGINEPERPKQLTFKRK